MKKRKISKTNKRASKQNNFIHDNFISGLIYLKQSWKFFVIAIFLILFASLIGYFGIIGIISPALGKTIDTYVTNSVQDLIKETAGLGPVQLTFYIMSNNIKTAFIGMLSGIFFTITSVVIVIFNGFVLGFVAQRAVTSPVNSEGIFVLWRLFPHGIFEIPAILISIGLGIKLGLYPIYLKDKAKGFLSILVSLVVFIFLSTFIMVLLVLIFQPQMLINAKSLAGEETFTNLFNNPIFSIIAFILMAAIYAISLIVGLKILSNKDREIVKEILANSFRVFVFIIIPLLIIAGIIEGLLIYLVG